MTSQDLLTQDISCLQNKSLYLASSSPRRSQLLTQLGVTFQTLQMDYEEPNFEPSGGSIVNITEVVQFVTQLARCKIKHGALVLSEAEVATDAGQHRLPPILAADTVIFHHGKVLEKPTGLVQAQAMLRQLSAGTHQVITAIALGSPGGIEEAVSISEVSFQYLSDQLIQEYLATQEYIGKAGAYAVQGFAAAFITKIAGSYSGVMGLPLCETAQLLHKFRIPYWKSVF